MPDYSDIPISSFPDAQSVDASDKVTGLKSGSNTNFSFNSILAWLISQFYAVFLPASSKGAAGGVASLDSTGKVPSDQLPPISSDAADITYDPTSSGLTATNVQDAVDEMQGEIDNLPSPPAPSDANPQDLGTAAAGSSANYSRADHVHQKPTYSKTDVGLGNVANERQYSSNNPPPYPVTSVNGSTGAVTVSVPSAYTSNPAMDGTASPGSSGAWAKGDHVHPSDTSKANQAQLATVESGTTASRAYDVGEYFCLNGLLYRVASEISSGATFTPGTNCEPTTVGASLELKAPAGYGLGAQLNTLTAAANCNEVDKTGWFDCPPATLNRPTGITTAYSGMLYSVVRGAQYRYQEYYAPRDTKVFRRFRNESGWGAWTQI